MKRLLLVLAGIFCIILLYLVLWPVPFDPAAWSPQQLPPLTGVLKPNNRLSEIELLKTGHGPEAVAIDNQGRIYTGLSDGRIIRIMHDRSKIETFCNTNGRPCGLKFDAGGNLIVADAFKGLLSINKSGIITVLCNEINGVRINFADDLDIAKDGTIYFSDASTKFSYDQYVLDFWEFRPHGRLLAYYPATKNVKILLKDLYFANGVAVSHDQTFVLVNETSTYRIRRYWISGPKKGQSDYFIENLPGMPDNITFNGKNSYWIAIVQGPLTRNALDPLIPKPFLRKVLYRLPEFLKPAPIRQGYVLGLDLDGKVMYNYQDPTGKIYAEVTSVIEHNGAIYLGSIGEDSIGRLIIY